MPAGYSPQIWRRLRNRVLTLTAAIAACFVAAALTGVLDWLEDRTADWRVVHTARPEHANPDIVFIDIDNASFRVLTDKLGRWPWTRRVWTEVVRYVSPGGPRLIVIDALFSGAEPGADEEFAQVMREAGNVVLPFAFVAGQVEADDESLFSPPEAALVAGESRRALSRERWLVNQPHPILRDSAAATGSNLWTPDPDGITRRLPLVTGYGDRTYATLWLAAAWRLLEGEAPMRAEHIAGEFRAGPVRLPVDREGRYVVRWHGDSVNAYRAIPLWEVICSIYPDQCDPAVTRHAPEEFRDKIVFVGASAAGSYEVRPLAVSETAPGMLVLATALDNLLANEGVRRAPLWIEIALILALLSFPSWSLLHFRSVTAPLALTLGLTAGYAGMCFALYARAYWLPMALPSLAAGLSLTANLALRYLTADRELSRTRDTLERYVSPQLVRYVMDHISEFRFAGEKRKLTVFFSDVRGFTTLTEKTDPATLLEQLNQYLEAMTDIVFRHDGIVDKFMGDGIMAHWGAFTPDRPNAWLAARASLDMLDKLAEMNVRWKAEGRPEMNIGVGLNTDTVIFGNVGAGKKLDFTAIGDGVNLAARLESANKEYGTRIIISETTYQELGDAAEVRPLGSIVVKGKSVGVKIYELLSLR
ncbi:MAG: adenylate/guanylate cyclase domain-containing protein [Bryobacterales bacterium]|nr:adenylate/guanylate cyclase domain-containing protein [Bryobacterales bacterium]